MNFFRTTDTTDTTGTMIWKLGFMQNIFRDSKRFSVISLSGWNSKTRKLKTSMLIKTDKENKMLMSLQQRRRGMPYNNSFIDRASSVKIAGYWPCFRFAVHKNAQMDLYPL